MDTVDTLDLERAYKDASKKVGDLPNRLRDEYQQAEADGRKPIPILPLTPIRADLVIAILDAIPGEPPKELQHVVTAQRRSCAQHGKEEVALLSEQVKALMDAAGLGKPAKEETPAKVTDAPIQG